MSFLTALFKKTCRPGEDLPGLEPHLPYLATLHQPAIALPRADGAHLSRLGGLPVLPAELAWPAWQGTPLAFLCQLDLSEIPAACERRGLPDTGILYFFYCQNQETWGFSPQDKGSWQVLYTPRPAADCTERSAPDGLARECIYPVKPLAFAPVLTYPDWQDERVAALHLNDRQGDEYGELSTAVFGSEPAHHLFGYPTPVQDNDMDLECQLVSHGLYCGDPAGYQTPEARELEGGRAEWTLLLQLDSDDDAGMMWGDCGMLYFWIKESDLRQSRFEECWMILQCS